MVNIEKNYPNFQKTIDSIAKQSTFQKKAILKYIESVDQRYLDFAEDLIERLIKVINRGECYDYIARTYLWYTKTIRIEEMYFSKHGSYRFTDYNEVFEKVYGRNDYMFDYVVGLGMTQIFWPNHWEIMKFYLDTFIPRVIGFKSGAEIGVGHGIFHSEFLRRCPNMNSILLDISPTSLEMTKKMITATGLNVDRIMTIQTDIQKNIPISDSSLDALLMGELIEHIQEGEAVMSSMAKKMKNNGFCYFSTAANSPAEDHILLFRNIDEIRTFINKTGWCIIVEHLGTINNMTIEESEANGYNINYAAVLAKK